MPALRVFVVLLVFAAAAHAQNFKPGDAVEYKVGGSTPPQWERGTIVKAYEGGKQYLVREKPSRFFPEGFEKTYAAENLRAPKDEKASTDTPAAPKPGTTAAPPKASTAAGGPLTKAEVVAYAKSLFGSGDPFADSEKRDKNLNAIRDYIKTRGVAFVADDTFNYKDLPNGMNSVHIGAAIQSNYGPHPKLENYYGTYLLRTTNRGSKTSTKDGSRVVVTTTDAQFESGALVIAKGGTFTWKLGRTDPESKWITGKWREATADEMQPWEGGPMIVLEKARQGEDYTVRMCRVPGYEKWIDVGMGKGRIAASYGRPE
ncbi:MAG: hypothetical protein KF873_01035 [Gemmataceae bacterium]|nr:hypothetical protein [Gemmataceae bacterium]